MNANLTKVLVQRHDERGLCTLTLNRPAVLNALNRAVFQQLRAHVDALASQPDSAGCVLLRGAGRAFCAGADLRALEQASLNAPLDPFEPEVVEAFAALPQPTIAAVHGHCLTGGLELALAADFIVAADDARFADTHARWGLSPAWGMSVRLPDRIGLARAKELMFSGRELQADEAHAIGLVNQVWPRDAFEDAARELGLCIAHNARSALRWTKSAVDSARGRPPKEALAEERARHPGLGEEFLARIHRIKPTGKFR